LRIDVMGELVECRGGLSLSDVYLFLDELGEEVAFRPSCSSPAAVLALADADGTAECRFGFELLLSFQLKMETRNGAGVRLGRWVVLVFLLPPPLEGLVEEGVAIRASVVNMSGRAQWLACKLGRHEEGIRKDGRFHERKIVSSSPIPLRQ
jgi:hypothetical protein